MKKLKPTAEETQFSVTEMIHIFEKTLTRDKEERRLLPKNLVKDIIRIMVNNVKIEYRCKDRIEAFFPSMIPSILNDMIKGEAIFEVLKSYDEAMMTYDEIFDLSLEMLMTLSLKRDSECKKIKGFCNQLKKIEIRSKKSNKEHRRSSRDNCPTNNYLRINQMILEAKLMQKNTKIKEIIKRNNKIMGSRIIRIR